MSSLPSERPEADLQPLTGERTDAWRIRVGAESCYHKMEDMRLRARKLAGTNADWALINLEIGLALSHLANVRRLAEGKRRLTPLQSGE